MSPSRSPRRSSPTPKQCLRSCLSPSRTSSGDVTPAQASPRSMSLSSDSSLADGSWRRTKSVRWEGENEGCAVTSYHPTWSATEYDRTPLEPPSEAERTCVLPERGARCIGTAYDCFNGSAILDYDYPDSSSSLSSSPFTSSSMPFEDLSQDSLVSSTPPDCDGEQNDSSDEEEDNLRVEEKEWEECMERRRLMFAMQNRNPHEGGRGGGIDRDCACGDDENDRQPEFEGYRSISATLVDLLRSIESRQDEPPPPPLDMDDSHADQTRSVFSNLRELSTATNQDDDGDDSTDEEDEDEGDNANVPTPSLASSAGSEVESSVVSVIVSPCPSVAPALLAALSVTGQEGKEQDDGAVQVINAQVLAAEDV